MIDKLEVSTLELFVFNCWENYYKRKNTILFVVDILTEFGLFY